MYACVHVCMCVCVRISRDVFGFRRWVPAAEKTKMVSFSHSGMYMVSE